MTRNGPRHPTTGYGGPHHPGSGPGGGRHPATHPNGGPKPPTKPPTAKPPVPTPVPFQQSAFDQMLQILGDYGLGSLSDVLRGLILDGVTDQASLTLALQDTDEWRKRFAGNEQLRANGLPVLSVAEYLSVERSYAQIMKNYGLPAGFYDDPSDFANFIGKSVSVNELQQRVQIRADIVKREDPAIKAQLLSMGMTEGDLIAHAIDPDKAMPLIERQYKTALVGAAARRSGITPDNEYAGHLTDLGVTEQQAMQGYGIIGENLGDMQKIGEVYGTDYSQRDFESEVFENNGLTTKKRKTLASQERAAFNGNSGIGQGSLSRPTGGTY